jgi:hypothetical protein
MQYTLKDFNELGKNHLISKDGKYQLWNDKGFFYPCCWFYKEETFSEGNF